MRGKSGDDEVGEGACHGEEEEGKTGRGASNVVKGKRGFVFFLS